MTEPAKRIVPFDAMHADDLMALASDLESHLHDAEPEEEWMEENETADVPLFLAKMRGLIAMLESEAAERPDGTCTESEEVDD